MNKLVISDLEYTYKDQAEPVKVLKGVSAEFSEGKLYAIQGESGSGKTTLLSLLSALDEIQDGDIKYNDKSIREIGLSDFRLKYVNIVFQSFNLIKYMTAAENVQVAIDFAGRHDDPLKYLKKVGLDAACASRLVNKLSGGQQQRVAIARALASDVPIIVADEPTGNLDEDTEAKIIDVFKDLAHKDKKIVIIVTHSRKVAEQADKVLKLSRGKIS
ncbi:ATP-binding cassette domain-containing protein [Candidatus Saccharibacteria bacterium]|nr:ATP-binding cassette domain-containing protein [Candidatus Saccharibacteria bacterium]